MRVEVDNEVVVERVHDSCLLVSSVLICECLESECKEIEIDDIEEALFHTSPNYMVNIAVKTEAGSERGHKGLGMEDSHHSNGGIEQDQNVEDAKRVV